MKNPLSETDFPSSFPPRRPPPPSRATPARMSVRQKIARSLLVTGCVGFFASMIVMGGGASQISSIYINVPARLQEYVFGKEADTPIVPAKHGDSSGVRGAAWLWPLE